MKELYRKYRELIVYFIVGCLTTLVSWVVYAAGVEVFHWSVAVSNAVSWIAAVTFAYFTNRKFVFESKNSSIMKEMAKFYAARIGTLLMDMGIMFVLVSCLGFSDKIIKLFVQVVVTVANYLFSKFIVFRKG